jgi:catechol 2,3-dioxygenase-like lactoylglutathione lyase family enzyme
MRWVSVGPPSQPDIHIVLEPPAADPGISPSDRTVISDLLAKGLLRGLNFSTPDLEGTFDRLQATGAEVVQEPMDMPYGSRECAFRDPAGNLIRMIQTRG